MRKLFGVAGLVVILGCLNHTQAQVDTTGYTNQVITGTLQSMDLSSRLRAGGARGSAATRGTRSPLSAATFQSVAASIIPQKLAATAATPAERKRQQAFFTERLREYEAVQRERGLPLKDVAHAMGYSLASSYNVHVGDAKLTEDH